MFRARARRHARRNGSLSPAGSFRRNRPTVSHRSPTVARVTGLVDDGGAFTGDLVRARVDDRDAERVEGVLHLRYIPARDYVQVRVLNDVGGFLVDPASVEVIHRAVVTVGELEDSDPVRGEPGWRRVTDLDQACRDGLVHDVVRQGGSWTDMFERLRHMIGPLLEAGWAIIDEDRETSANYGDSVSYVLERSDDVMQLELYEDDAIMLWPFDENWSSAEGVGLPDVDQISDDVVTDALRGVE